MPYYPLIWLLTLITGLLLTAAMAALSARKKRALLRLLWPGLTLGLCSLAPAGLAIIGAAFRINNLEPRWLLPYGLSLLAAYVIGAVVVLRRAFKPKEAGPAAARWPRAGLLAVFCLSLSLTLAAVLHLDQDRRVKLESLRAESVRLARGVLPQPGPGAGNALLLYDEAGRLLDAAGLRDLGPDQAEEGRYDYASGEAGDVARRLEPLLDLVRRAAGLSSLGLVVDPENLPALVRTSFGRYEAFARALAFSAKVRAARGDGPGAAEDLETLGLMAGQLRAWPTRAAFLAAGRVEERQTRALEYALARRSKLPELSAAAPGQPGAPLEEALIRAWRLEEAAALQALSGSNRSSRSPGDAPGLSPLSLLFWRVFLMESDLESFRRMWNALRPGGAGPFYQGLRQRISAAARSRGGLLTAAWFHPGEFIDDTLRAEEFEARRGQRRLAQAAAAYRAQNGRWPESAGDLVPGFLDALPVDPFSGRPLEYARTGDGAEIRSIGPQSGPLYFRLGPAPDHT